MMTISRKTLVRNIIGSLFIFMWLGTAFSKIIGYDTFLAQLHLSTLLRSMALPVSILVPAAELAIAVALIIGVYGKPRWLRYGLAASAGLLMVFTLYISTMLLTNSHLPCTCGGFIQKLSWPQHLAFNIVLIVIAMTGILLMNENKKTLSRHREERSDLGFSME